MQDGITYNKCDLWDGIVLIETELRLFMEEGTSKTVAGKNESPNSFQWKTVYENSVAVFEKSKMNGTEMEIQ